jgi:hypothetical protein
MVFVDRRLAVRACNDGCRAGFETGKYALEDG